MLRYKMIKLRKYEWMQVCARDLVSASVHTTCGGGRVYDIKTLHSNLANREGGGVYSRGVYN